MFDIKSLLDVRLLINILESGERGDWIELAQDRDRWRALSEYGNELSGSIKCGEFLD